jgi:hypothetical protein
MRIRNPGQNVIIKVKKTVETKIFQKLLIVYGRIRIRTNNYGSGSGTPGSGTQWEFWFGNKIFGLAGIPVEVDEDEETIKIVQLVKSQDTLRNASFIFRFFVFVFNFLFSFVSKLMMIKLLS